MTRTPRTPTPLTPATQTTPPPTATAAASSGTQAVLVIGSLCQGITEIVGPFDGITEAHEYAATEIGGEDHEAVVLTIPQPEEDA